ncbi:MAG: hypothetical protein JF605_02475 [Burkholderia sp.]|nr:hypothetical protein [Burkholderia sp.]
MTTVNYVTTLAFHYQMFGETPPDDSKLIAQFNDEQHFQIISYAQLKEIRREAGY